MIPSRPWTRQIEGFLLLLLLRLLALAPAPSLASEGPPQGGAPRWAHPLYLAGDGVWRKRVPVEIANASGRKLEGFPVTLRVGRRQGEIDLVGARAEELRATDSSGVEILLEIRDRDGATIRRGGIQEGVGLTLPVSPDASATQTLYVYFDNPSAWPVPDFFGERAHILNGGVERGEGNDPTGWVHDEPDATHRAIWVAEHPRSGAPGTRCLKTIVEGGAEPTWVATRQSGIRVVGGARYTIHAWVRAEGVEGFAGWYAHVGNERNPMLIAPMLSGGGGTYDWKEVISTFEAPADAVTLSVGTVLRGTGVAWFDDVSLEPEREPAIRARALPVEGLRLREVSGGVEPEVSPEVGGARADPSAEALRATVRVFHLSEIPLERALVVCDAARVLVGSRRFGRSLRPVLGSRTAPASQAVPAWTLGHRILVQAPLPARSVTSLSVAFVEGGEGSGRGSPRAEGSLEDPGMYAKLLEGQENLVKDGSFEEGGPKSSSPWYSGDAAAGIAVEREEGGLFGRRCGRIRVEGSATPAWSGWRQSVPVEAGGTYLYAAWVRCEDVRDGSVALHAHLLRADGTLSPSQGFASVGPDLSGTVPWTLLAGTLAVPEDAVTFQLHLTMLARGTVRHDGALLVRLVEGVLTDVRDARVVRADGIAAWQVPSVVKVFREDGPPTAAAEAGRAPAADPPAPVDPARESPVSPCRISLCPGEAEPLQIAFRSPRTVAGVRVEVDPPRNEEDGSSLETSTHVVGYVPIDHRTSYYRSEAPSWQRKVPRGEGASDGWPGSWPDPLLPTATLDLPAGETRPVWVTVRAGAEAPSGEYRGRVRLVAREEAILEVPFGVRVRGFALPRERHVGAIYDVRLDRRWQIPGKSEEEVRLGVWRFLAERRLSADRIQPEPVLRYEEDRVVADFTEYDRAGERYFGECAFPFTYTPWVFYLFGWGHPPGSKFGEAPYDGEYPYAGVDRGRLRPEFRRAYQACLATYWDHMKERGWSDRCILYISDEPFDGRTEIREQMKALCAMIREVDPTIPIYSSTWHHQPAWDGALGVWGVGHYGVVPPEILRAIRTGGARVWFTTDGHMCTDTPLAAIERLLPHYCFQFGAEAYEFWGCTWLTYDPFAFGWHRFIHQSEEPGQSIWVRYPNGDGYLAYPGQLVGHDGPVSSIRLEQAREGVEDYEYLFLLRGLAERASQKGLDTLAAERALQRARSLVAIPNAGGRYSTRMLPDPEELYRVRDAVAEAIEGLLERMGEP